MRKSSGLLRLIMAWMRGDEVPPYSRTASSAKSSSLSLLAELQGSLLLLSTFGGLVAGGSIAGLVTLINKSLDQDSDIAGRFAPLYVCLCIVALTTGLFSELLLMRLAQNRLVELRLSLSRHILSARLERLQALGPHRLMATLTEDISNVVNSLETLPPLLTAASTLLGGLLYMGWLSTSLSLMVLLFVVVGAAGFSFAQKWSHVWQQQARQTSDALFGHFRAVTEACKELKMNARRRHAFISELEITANIVKHQLSHGRTIAILAAYWGRLLFFLLIGIILFVLPRFQGVSHDTVTGFMLVVLFIMSPISIILSILPTIGKGIIALLNIRALGVAVAEEPHLEAEGELPGDSEQPSVLELVQVKHRYHAERGESGFLLGPLDLRIQPGELVFLTGGNGSGKTTLALLLLGLYPPDEGELRLGDTVITDLNRDFYRQHFAVVFSDAYVFDSLVWYPGDDLSKRGAELLVRLQLYGKVQIQEGRFSTVDLSRGQRKRLALLAAYLEDRPFYLFDEWAAEQDPLFRDVFYKELLPQLKARGKTIIVITHDDRYFHLADRLLRLNLGKVEEKLSAD